MMQSAETITALLVGLGLGFIGSMPIAGPIAVLVLERGLSRRFADGVRIAVGAAVAESIHSFLAFWGLGAVVRTFPMVLPTARLVGAAVLIAIGVYLVRKKTSVDVPVAAHAAGRQQRGFLLGLTLTLLNPTLIATWTVTVAAVHSTGALGVDPPLAVPFALGVGLGIVVWFVMMLQALNRFQRAVRPATVDKVIHVVGWLVVGLGAVLAARQLLESARAAFG